MKPLELYCGEPVESRAITAFLKCLYVFALQLRRSRPKQTQMSIMLMLMNELAH